MEILKTLRSAETAARRVGRVFVATALPSALLLTACGTPPESHENLICNGVVVTRATGLTRVETAGVPIGGGVYIAVNGAEIEMAINTNSKTAKVVWEVPEQLVGSSEPVGSLDYSLDPERHSRVTYTVHNSTTEPQAYPIQVTIEDQQGGRTVSADCPPMLLTVVPQA